MTEALIVVAFLAACLALGARQKREDALDGWLLAGRGLTLPAFVATLVPTFYGGALGVGEFTWTAGLSNWTAMALPYYVFAAVYALALAERVRLEPGLTIPDHLERAYGRGAALLGALLVFLLASPADSLLMSGVLLGRVSGAGTGTASAAAALLAFLLLWRGGLRSDAAANALQLVVMFGGFALVLAPALRAAGGPAGLASRLPPGHLSWTGGMGIGKLVGWWLIAVWTLVDPAFHQRCAAARTPGVARRGILVSIGFWAVFDLMTTTAGLCARALLPELADPVLAFPRLAELVLPPVARGLFLAGLAASLSAALQGNALLSAASLGKDGLARALGRGEADARRWTRAGLAASLLLGLALARLLPSVVGLWYAIGSAAVPGLLLPMLGVYRPGLRVPGRWAAAASAGGWLVSLAWVAAGARRGSPPLGLEPIFPGLAVSAAVWAAGYSSARAAHAAPASTPQAPQ